MSCESGAKTPKPKSFGAHAVAGMVDSGLYSIPALISRAVVCADSAASLQVAARHICLCVFKPLWESEHEQRLEERSLVI